MIYSVYFKASFGKTSGRYWLVQEACQQQKLINMCRYKHRYICIYTSKYMYTHTCVCACVCLLKENVGLRESALCRSNPHVHPSTWRTNKDMRVNEKPPNSALWFEAVCGFVSLSWLKTLTLFGCRAQEEESGRHQPHGSLGSFFQQLKSQTQMINYHFIHWGKMINIHSY